MTNIQYHEIRCVLVLLLFSPKMKSNKLQAHERIQKQNSKPHRKNTNHTEKHLKNHRKPTDDSVLWPLPFSIRHRCAQDPRIFLVEALPSVLLKGTDARLMVWVFLLRGVCKMGSKATFSGDCLGGKHKALLF